MGRFEAENFLMSNRSQSVLILVFFKIKIHTYCKPRNNQQNSPLFLEFHCCSHLMFLLPPPILLCFYEASMCISDVQFTNKEPEPPMKSMIENELPPFLT